MSRNHTDGGWTASDSRKWRAIIGAQLPAPCVNPRLCGGALVYPDQLWDVGHVQGLASGGEKRSDNLGPAHRRCNRSDGGREGAAAVNTKRNTNERKSSW